MFLAIEGPDGAGKSTQVRALATHMHETCGQPILTTREPTDSPLGSFLRAEHASLSPRSRALAVAADRANHLHATILPAIQDGVTVITDRYVPSSLVLQRLDGLSLDEIWRYNSFSLPPTLTVILAPDSEVIAKRLDERGELTYFEKLATPARQAELYGEAAEFLSSIGWNITCIDANERLPTEIAEQIMSCVEDSVGNI